MQNDETAVLIPIREETGTAEAAFDDFALLVRSHQQRIYRLLLGMVRDPDVAENLTQDCFLRAYKARASFRGDSSVGAWLIKIAVNLARDHRRTSLREFWQRLFPSSEDFDDIVERQPDPRASQERALLAREEVARVWSAVDELSSQQRAVFVLRFVEEMSLEEIAEATSLKVGTVKSHLFRAIRTLRERFKEGSANG